MKDFKIIEWALNNKSKALAVLIAMIYLIIAYTSKPELFFKILMFLILPLFCILFSEEMGGYKGWSGIFGPRIDQTSPGIIVAILGWMLLLMPVIIIFITVSLGK